RANIRGIGTEQERAAHIARFEGKVTDVDAGFGAQMRAAEQQAAVNLEVAKISNEDRSRVGQARRRLEEFLTNTNTAGPEQLSLFGLEMGNDPASRRQFEARVAARQDPNR